MDGHSVGNPILGYSYNKTENGLDSGNLCGWIFRNGDWAEILPQPTELTVAEIEAKLGFPIKIIK